MRRRAKRRRAFRTDSILPSWARPQNRAQHRVPPDRCQTNNSKLARIFLGDFRLPGGWRVLPAARGPAAGANALNSRRGFVRLEPGAAGKLQKSATDCGIGQILDAAAPAADQIVAGFVRSRDLIEDRSPTRLPPAHDPAPREEGQGAVDRCAGKATSLPLQAKPERLGVEVARRLGDRLEHAPPRDGRPQLVAGQKLGPLLSGIGGRHRDQEEERLWSSSYSPKPSLSMKKYVFPIR